MYWDDINVGVFSFGVAAECIRNHVLFSSEKLYVQVIMCQS